MNQQHFADVADRIRAAPDTWLITGVAGFIGSNLLEALLGMGQHVIGVDNFATGRRENLDDVRRCVGDAAWRNFDFIEGDVADLATCRGLFSESRRPVRHVLHQAALGSVPRSLKMPELYVQANVVGCFNVLLAAREAGLRRFVYASSSSVYGDHEALPKVEGREGRVLSPYSLTKRMNEQTAELFGRVYGMECIGLRYFNVFGRRQDPHGEYAGVIPRWIGTLLSREPCTIFGDGETSRDFCYIANVVQANVLAALTEDPRAVNRVYNVAYGDRITLNELYAAIRDGLATMSPAMADIARLEPAYAEFRAGDIRHSLADISQARDLLGYAPTHSARQGIAETLAWYAAALA